MLESFSGWTVICARGLNVRLVADPNTDMPRSRQAVRKGPWQQFIIEYFRENPIPPGANEDGRALLKRCAQAYRKHRAALAASAKVEFQAEQPEQTPMAETTAGDR